MRFWNPCLAWARIACRQAPTGSNKDMCQLHLSSSLSLGSSPGREVIRATLRSYSGFVEKPKTLELFGRS